MSKFLTGLGFIQSKQDYSLFTRTLPDEFLAILVYVDDMVVTGTNMTQINEIKQALDKGFTIKDLGDLNYLLAFKFLEIQLVCFYPKRNTLQTSYVIVTWI